MEKIKNIISSNTFKQTLVTSGGTIISGVLGMFFYILVARYLGPSSFGIFSVATTAMALIASVANIGIDTGLVRFVGKYYGDDKTLAFRFLKMGLILKILTSLIVLSLGWVLVPSLSKLIFGRPEFIFPLRLSLVGATSALLFSFVSSALQAIQKFLVWSWLGIASNVLRLVATIVVFSLGVLTINSSLAIYIIFPFFGFVIGLLFLPKFWKVTNEKQVLSEFLHYNKWIALFTLLVAFSSRLDTFIAAKLLSLTDLGIYSVAVTLASVIPSIILALATVVAPKLASYTDDKETFAYLKKLQYFVFGLAFAGILIGIPLTYLFVPYLYGASYLASVYPLAILIVAQALFLISIPAHTSVLYYFSYPMLFVYMGLVNLLIITIGGWYMVSSFGYMGAAYTVLIGNVFNFIIPFVWTLKKFKKL